MAKIKDWDINISGNRTELFISENGKEILVKDDDRDLARLREASENIIVSNSELTIIINESKKEITVRRK